MIYLLTLLVGGLATWPYYHRFKAFSTGWNPLPLAVFHAAPLAFGFAAVLTYASEHGNLNSILAFDLITGVTFWIMTIALTVWNAYLIFQSETYSAPDDFELALVVCIFVCAFSFFISCLPAYLIVTAVGSFS